MLPKSNVLTVAISGVLIVALLLAWLLVSKPTRGTASEGTSSSQSDKTGAESERPTELETTPMKPRADVATAQERETAARASKTSSLRIHVHYSAAGLDAPPERLEVGISNRHGTSFQPQEVAPNEYVLAEASAGDYIIAAQAHGFRPAVTRVRISAQERETTATITLMPSRLLRVRWRTDDGRPIQVSIADVKQFTESVLLEVYATKFSMSDARPLDRHALAVLRSKVVIDESEPGARVAHEKRIGWARPEPIDPRASTDIFGTMNIDEEGIIWANAYCGGVCVATIPVQPKQTEIEFVTPLGDLERPGGTVNFIVVDDATGQPIEEAMFDGQFESNKEGLVLGRFIPPGPGSGRITATFYASIVVHFVMRGEQLLDLGTIRLTAQPRSAHFSVVDESGAPIGGLQFELIALDEIESRRSAHGASYWAPSDAMHRGDVHANLHFLGVHDARYVLRCNADRFDTVPRIVQASQLSTSERRSIAELAVQPAGKASFVLDAPFAKGTQVVIETPEGLPLRELDIDEFGIATTDILARAYRLHLIEYGRATGSIDVRVDSNPFVFEIRR